MVNLFSRRVVTYSLTSLYIFNFQRLQVSREWRTMSLLSFQTFFIASTGVRLLALIQFQVHQKSRVHHFAKYKLAQAYPIEIDHKAPDLLLLLISWLHASKVTFGQEIYLWKRWVNYLVMKAQSRNKKNEWCLTFIWLLGKVSINSGNHAL